MQAVNCPKCKSAQFWTDYSGKNQCSWCGHDLAVKPECCPECNNAALWSPAQCECAACGFVAGVGTDNPALAEKQPRPPVESAAYPVQDSFGIKNLLMIPVVLLGGAVVLVLGILLFGFIASIAMGTNVALGIEPNSDEARWVVMLVFALFIGAAKAFSSR